MLIKKETEYAVLGILALAQKKTGFYDAKVIASEEKISESLLSKVFQKLAAVNILQSRLGPNGGFSAHRSLKEINLLEVVRAVQFPNIIKCYDGHAPYCLKPSCGLRRVVNKMEGFLDDFMENTTLNELIRN